LYKCIYSISNSATTSPLLVNKVVCKWIFFRGDA